MCETESVTRKMESAITILLSILSLAFSIFTYNKLLATEEANLVFSENEVQVRSEKEMDHISASISNIGKVEARDIKLEIYSLFFNSKSIWKDGQSVIRFFHDSLAYNLDSGQKAHFGEISIGHNFLDQFGKSHNSYGKERVALIYCLSYLDALSKEYKRKTYMYHYVIGSPYIFSILKSEYNDSIRIRFEEFLSRQDSNECSISPLSSK